MSRRSKSKSPQIVERPNQQGIPSDFGGPSGFHAQDRTGAGRAEIQAGGMITVGIQQRTHSGPLPSPEVLSQYDQILPGAAERIIAMAEKQQSHRQSIEAAVVEGNVVQQRRGPIYGFVLAFIVIVGGLSLIFTGHSITGIAAVLLALGSLVSVFIVGRRKQSQELRQKADSLVASSDTEKRKPELQKQSG